MLAAHPGVARVYDQGPLGLGRQDEVFAQGIDGIRPGGGIVNDKEQNETRQQADDAGPVDVARLTCSTHLSTHTNSLCSASFDAARRFEYVTAA